MKKFIQTLSSVAILLGLSSSLALAQDMTVKVTVTCPGIGSKNSQFVQNYGDYLAGTGTSVVNSNASTRPLFEGPIVQGTKIPSSFLTTGYSNNGVSYNPNKGGVTCYYSSTLGYSPFVIAYVMPNAKNGEVSSSDVSQIHFKLPVASVTRA